MSSLYDSGLQNQIAHEQIQYLITEVETYHANDEEIINNLKQAHELNSTGNVQAAASIVYVRAISPFISYIINNTKGYYKSSVQEKGR